MSNGAGDEATTYQTLYRRFRPQRFAEVLGQDHVSLALRNAVRSDHVGHAYLFSGPRGTGKTSTARILAKALNCATPVDGEPCGVCDSCVEIARGSSLDVHELDAASNNGVDAMRDLVSHAALGTPGRWKVYIVDEVHMLSTAASNALLKTLEEPPSHVVFVLATTDVQKVLVTIRSRTQQYEFHLLGSDVLAGLLRSVREAAGLELTDQAVDSAVRRGRGSARDALSALDQVAAGGADDDVVELVSFAQALADRDTAQALTLVARAATSGLDAQRVSAELSDYLRQGFLSTVSPELVQLSGSERTEVAAVGARIGLAGLVRAMETLGRAQVDMRDSPDPRVHLEVALIRLTHPEADDSLSALLERVERLERSLGGSTSGGSPPAAPAAAAARTPTPEAHRADEPTAPALESEPPVPPRPSPPAGPESEVAPDAPSGPELARRSLSAVGRQNKGARSARSTDAVDDVSRSGAVVAPAPAPAGPSAFPTRDELVQVWGDGLLAGLPARARARFRVGRFTAVESGKAVFALPNETHRSYCEDVRTDVERALAAHFGMAVPLRLMVDEDAGERAPPDGGGEVATEAARTRAATAPVSAPLVSAPLDDAATVGAPPPRSVRSTGTGTDADAATEIEDEADLLDPEVLAAETELAGAGPTPEQRLKLAFPGAEEV